MLKGVLFQGTLTSPGYPNTRGMPGRRCIYFLKGPPGRALSFHFEDLDMMPKSDVVHGNRTYNYCRDQVLHPLELASSRTENYGWHQWSLGGNVLHPAVCGDVLPEDGAIRSSGNTMVALYFVMNTDSIPPRRGFKLHWDSLQPAGKHIFK